MALRILVLPDDLLLAEPANMPAETRPRARAVTRRALQLQQLRQNSPELQAKHVADLPSVGAFLLEESGINTTALGNELGKKFDPGWWTKTDTLAKLPSFERDDTMKKGWQREGTQWASPSPLKSLLSWFSITTAPPPAYDGTGSRVGVIELGLSTHDHVFQRVVSTAEVRMSGVTPNSYFQGTKNQAAHGTHVGGLIVGPEGIAKGATLAFATILDDSERANFLAIVLALDWLASTEHVVGEDFGCDVINLSMDVSTFEQTASPVFQRLLDDHGTLVVVANGNQGLNQLGFDACLTVGALGSVGPIPKYPIGTLYAGGPTRPDIFAAGQAVASCTPTAEGVRYKGTSFAAPQVSAAAAVLLQKTPALRGNGAAFKAAVLALSTPETYGLALDISKL